MPEHKMIKLNGNKYMVKNVKTGKVNAKSTSKVKAESQMRLLNEYIPGRRNH